jgi:CBS-domain-containing membrane protein
MRIVWQDLKNRLRLYFGVTAAFGLVCYSTFLQDIPILVAPLASSACLLFAIPEGKFARPKNVILGHALSAAVGVTTYLCMGTGWVANTVSVALAVALMDVTETMHPPAAATALLALTTGQGFSFVFRPVASGACILVLAAEIVRFSLRRPKE